MHTNINTASTVSATLKSQASRLAGLPNTFTMCDARALAFADLSSAMQLCAIHLAKFIATNDKAAARQYLPMSTRVSKAIALLSEQSENAVIGRALLSAHEALSAAHTEFQAHVESLLTANRAMVCA